ncbi:MAG TPA: hypothetical protein VGJ77_02220 [Gaiellaceae bacterium]|jgi:hypothetical protein
MARVVVNPLDLRRGASRLRDASKELTVVARALAGVGLPEMPAGVAAHVEGGIASARSLLDGNAPQLADGSVELERRALWAEIADRLDAGYPLSGTQLKEFVSWMKDGTLLRFATPHEAASAGRYLGVLYRGNFKHPDRLIELAQILRAGETWADPAALREFSGAFVESFGAQNLVEVPRVIQAIEWSHVINGSFSPQERHVLAVVAREWGDRDLEQDPVDDLLAPFAVALANATYSGRLTRTTEDAIAHDEDTWATAQLLTKGTFSTHFLLECFQTGVVQKIVEHSRWEGTAAGLGEEPHDAPYSLGRFWEHGDHEGVPYDTKQIVLAALARNPEAAQLALTTPLAGVEVFDRVGQQHAVTSPVRLLYDHGRFDDDGRAFGSAYTAAVDSYLAPGTAPHELDAGNKLTLAVLDRVIHGDRDDLGGVTDALASDLASHHLAALHEDAATNAATDHDGGIAGYIDPEVDHRIHLSRAEIVDTLSKVTGRDDAGRAFLTGAAHYQADSIAEGTTAAPTFEGDYSWAHRAGAFDKLLMEAGDVNRLHDFHDAQEQQRMVVGFMNDVVSLVKVNPVAGVAIHHGIDAIGDSMAPSADELMKDNDRAHAVVQNGLTAAIVKGYADHGHIDLSGAEQRHLVRGGSLVSYNELDGIPRGRFEDWMNNDPDVSRIVHEALQDSSR